MLESCVLFTDPLVFKNILGHLTSFVTNAYGCFLGRAGLLVGADILTTEQSLAGAQAATSQAATQVPDIAKAAASQGFLFALIDRVSRIDAVSPPRAAADGSASLRPVQHYHDLGMFSSSLPNSY